jgi:hypothetical protein
MSTINPLLLFFFQVDSKVDGYYYINLVIRECDKNKYVVFFYYMSTQEERNTKKDLN